MRLRVLQRIMSRCRLALFVRGRNRRYDEKHEGDDGYEQETVTHAYGGKRHAEQDHRSDSEQAAACFVPIDPMPCDGNRSGKKKRKADSTNTSDSVQHLVFNAHVYLPSGACCRVQFQ